MSLTYRYHAEKAPKGQIFDTDDLPSEKDGWCDSPKRFNEMKMREKGDEAPVLSGEFPDPRPFHSVKVYIAAVDPSIPAVPDAVTAKAHGMTDEQLEERRKESDSMKRRALLHYAKLKYDQDLARNGSPAKLLDQCLELDAR